MKKIPFRLRPTGLLQSEATECGLACVATILRLHGQAISLHALRREFGPYPRGMTLAQMSDLLSALDVGHLPVSMNPEKIPREFAPFIAHWEHNHYVVVLKLNTKRVELHDPAIGRYTISRQEFNIRFTGAAMLIKSVSQAPMRLAQTRSKSREIFTIPAGSVSSVLLVICIAAGIEAIAMTLPFQAQMLIDQLSLNDLDGHIIVLSAGLFAALSIIQFILGVGRSAGISWIGSKVNIAWSSELLKRSLLLPADFFTRRSLGETLSRFSSMESIQAALTSTACEIILSSIISLFAFGVMLTYSLQLTLIVTVFCAACLLLSIAGNAHLAPLSARAIITSAKQQTDLVETLRGMHAVKLANKESLRQSRYVELLTNAQIAKMHVQRVTSNYQLTQVLTQNLRRVLVLAFGTVLVYGKNLSLGGLVAFMAYAEYVGAHLSTLASHLQELLLLKVHSERINDITEAQPESTQISSKEALMKPSFEIRDVSFGYVRNEANVLNNVSLRVEYGQCVAITGDSGGGKSTLFNIMTGSLLPSSGHVLIDDQDIHDFGLNNFREHIAVVRQEDTIFSGSIAENISFFDPNFSMDRIIAAASAASIHKDISEMPMGYSTPVGDMGSTLSGGQRQRILIARAIYREPKLLFLDEATSSLDMKNAEIVDQAIRKTGITRIIVAHRKETIAMADRVFEVKNGQLINIPGRQATNIVV
ncbi:Toxin RTX-I translocation ATP-binding protein [Xanthomonas sacchari]|uniref:peptidase domain-containing ABC transporter n=1 Tax=Xanthomonas sacchari TaxID=56458 RepID=UPI00299F55FC|nr:peptidase domain-containing ABC transporter [Xanthomonas sacchari]MCW0366451.1 Toxin RTX-I translocation ATP-binding protein [Xanthomonas sacchari]MCW0440524.1 Toxin RTX-I translocation ATP-binding protein [Xanthomonas sacchari]